MATEHLSLDGRWSLAGFDGYGMFLDQHELPAVLPNLCWLSATVPGSVYTDLLRAGWLAELYTGCNTLAAQWVEQQYWFYRRRFEAPPPRTGQRCDLVLDGLDLDAVVYLNGRPVATHHNAFRPIRVTLDPYLQPGENELIVRLSSGLLEHLDQRGGDYHLELTAAATRRAFLRKPHFACRWDWAPRLMNVGIGGGVWLELCDELRLGDVRLGTYVAADHSAATLSVRAVVENLATHPREVMLSVRLAGTDVRGATVAELPPGTQDFVCELPIAAPRLWWPRGYGAAELYDVEVTLIADSQTHATRHLRTGLRSVELAQPPAEDGGRLLHLRVNGEPIFCKGANWVPADLLPARVTALDYRALVGLAVECHCNLLRIWGGGVYADPELLAACDEAGILVWHDLMFACSTFPGDDPAFVQEVVAEVRHQVRRLSSHPSLAVWCGNNEVDVGVTDGWLHGHRGGQPCHTLFHKTLAQVVAEEDPSRPWWPSSPSSPDGAHPNAPHIGDQHPWDVALGAPKGDYWHYRHDASRFPNEGGMLGPSTPPTIESILPSEERFLGSRTWNHHDNSQNTWKGEPLLDHLLRVNLCPAPRRLPFEDYLRYAALLHGEALETAIDNWRRRKFDTSAAIFWMFNDTWPMVTSWTPIDYYRRRKPAFWYVKRAFAPLRAICTCRAERWCVIVVNDTRVPQRLTLRTGLFALAGGRRHEIEQTVNCPANGAVVAFEQPLREWDVLGITTHGAFATWRTEDGTIGQQRLFRARFAELAWTPAEVTVSRHGAALTLTAERFSWAVCLDPTGETPLADNYMDLLPGIPCTVPWPAGMAIPRPTVANPPAAVLTP
ncbi:MAG: hypothetical protein IPM18_17780 [Phycisphaerales bacterium]|nr:hypothetical protein [Phycisphaerales bacterium]